MRYMVMLSMAADVGPPPAALVEAMDELMQEASASGLLVDAGGLMPAPDATQLQIRAGALSRMDGPFAEATEVVGGYAVLDVRSHEEAVENARRTLQLHLDHWPGWQGTADVRRIAEGPPEA